MRAIKNYTGIWKVEGVFYGVRDFHLPRPVTYTQIIWAGIFFVISLGMKGIPPFIFDSVLLNNVAIPIALAVFLNKKSFDGKKPLSFIRSGVLYLVQPKDIYLGRPVDMQESNLEEIDLVIGERREVDASAKKERILSQVS